MAVTSFNSIHMLTLGFVDLYVVARATCSVTRAPRSCLFRRLQIRCQEYEQKVIKWLSAEFLTTQF